MQRRLILIAAQLLLSACSSVDSTQPFNQPQAAQLLTQGKTIHPTQQMIALSLPNKRQWQKIDMSLGTVGTPIMLVPNNATTDNWNQSIRTQILAFAEDHEATPYKLMQNKIAALKQDCRHVSNNILSENSKQIIYRLEIANCHQEKNQTQYGKAIKGVDAIYAVYYSAVSGAVSSAQINQLSQRIQAAQLARNPRHYSS